MKSKQISFARFPKQWILSPEPLETPQAGHEAGFAGYHVQAAEAVPLVPVHGADGVPVGLLIGWAIHGAAFLHEGGQITLEPGQGIDDLFTHLGGRFVLVWQDADGVHLRLDSAGSLPAVVHPASGCVAATTTLIEEILPLEADPAVVDVFNFPAERGFLPYGLTPRRGVTRLMPNFRLDLADMSIRRIWAARMEDRVTASAAPALAREMGDILKSHMAAILAAGPSVLYLSGGHDSRIVLAAARGLTDRLRAETYGPPGSLETHVAGQAAAAAGIAHRAIPLTQASPEAIEAWLRRTGWTFYDHVTDMTETVLANEPAFFPMSGTGAELSRASNWGAEELDADALSAEVLRAKIRMPDVAVINAAAEAWLATLPPMDAALAMDMAKIEQIHACWSGVEIYGHDMARPTLNPFSSQALVTRSLALPKAYRASNGFYRDVMPHMWPELGAVAINKAEGIHRLRFWREELKARVPTWVKRKIKPLR